MQEASLQTAWSGCAEWMMAVGGRLEVFKYFKGELASTNVEGRLGVEGKGRRSGGRRMEWAVPWPGLCVQ